MLHLYMYLDLYVYVYTRLFAIFTIISPAFKYI